MAEFRFEHVRGGICIVQKYTATTAVLLDYKNGKFSQEVREKHQEQADMVEIGLAYPSLAQLKKSWMCAEVKDGLCITGYKGNNTIESIPAQTKNGKPIVKIGTSNRGDFKGLSELVIPEGVIEIEEAAFKGCTGLSQIAIPTSVTELGEAVFSGCTNLGRVDLPEGVQVGRAAFENCPFTPKK